MTEKQPIKQINTAQDLEGVKFMDKIRLIYHLSSPTAPAYVEDGFFGGSFVIDNDKYIMFSKIERNPLTNWAVFATSSLYKINENAMVAEGNVFSGSCPTTDPSHLVKELNRHAEIFKDDKLEKLRQANAQ